jgi:cytochrome b
VVGGQRVIAANSNQEDDMTSEERVKVWDVGVRLFHWTLVVLFTVAYLSGDDESTLHVYAGYGVIALIVFRIVWGFVGTRHARFADFIRGPKATMAYAKSLLSGKPVHYLGHNPLGGWMVIALLLSVAATSWSGLEAYAAEGHGPLAGQSSHFIPSAFADDDEAGEGRGKEGGGDEFWEEAHEVLANFTVLLVFLHIAGVVVSSVMHRESLVKAMITGYKTIRKP